MEWRAATVVGAIPLGPSRERRAQLSHHAKAGTIAVQSCIFRILRLQDYSVPSLDLESDAPGDRQTFGGVPPLACRAVLAADCSQRGLARSHIPYSSRKKRKVLR